MGPWPDREASYQGSRSESCITIPWIALTHPTCDPGADQMISARDADAAEIVRGDGAFVGNTARGGSLSRCISPLSPNINNARVCASGRSISIGRRCHDVREPRLVRRSTRSPCLRREYTHFAYRPFLPKNKWRTWSPSTF